jgi:mRNA deadenylase 3'-5' endonuclease subunit Ccr4
LSFSVATYNVLATAYIQPARYRRSPALVLDPSWRTPALVRHVSSLDADILCLQEVEIETFAALRARLTVLGYLAQYARKQGGKPDGCATFYRQDRFELSRVRVIEYADGNQAAENSGHIALVVFLRNAGLVAGVVNTHLPWEPPETPLDRRRSYRDIRQLLAECRSMSGELDGLLICGDLNETPESEVVAALREAGFRHAHESFSASPTCKVNAESKTIDYLFYSSALRAEPSPLPPISYQAALPSAEQPSDHLAVASRFDWNFEAGER